MAPSKPHIRRAAAIAGTALLAVSLTAPAAAAGTAEGLPASQSGTAEFNTLHELQQATGLSGTVRTVGDEYADDGAGMTYTVTSTKPTDETANVSMPLADGQWAVPQGFATAPSTQPSAAGAEDLITRGKTFVDAGTQLQWDASRPTPLTGKVVHAETSAPYPVTCSAFVGMALMGWDYNSTTYVADKNTKVGYGVDFGPNAEGSHIWQANNLASWFYANGDLWLDTDGQYQRGDVLFFSSHNPTVSPGYGPGATSTFGNVYHVAIYLGDGMLMHSTGRAAGQGVHISKMGSSLEADLSFVARPGWSGSQSASNASDQSAGTASTSAQSSAQGAAPQSAAEAAPQAAPEGQGAGESTGQEAAEGAEGAAQQDEQGAAQSSGAGAQGAAQPDGSSAVPTSPESTSQAVPGSQSTAVAVIAASDVEADVNQSSASQNAESKARAAQPSAEESSGLPRTGTSITIAVIAALLVAGGAGLVLMRRMSARRAAVAVTTSRTER